MIRFFSIIILTLFLSVSCKQDYEDLLQIDEEKKIGNMIVTYEQVSPEDIAIPIYAIGKVGTANETRLSFKVGGIIEVINVEEGDYVRKGQLIASLRKTEIEAQVSKAQRAYEKSVRDLDRITKMYDDEAATLENLEDLTTLVEVRKSDLDIALFNQVYATIVSPVSGRVISKLGEDNESIAPGKTLVIIAGKGTQAYVLKTGISDKDLSRVKLGDRADVTLDAFDQIQLNGRVSKIAESANPLTGTFDIEISMNIGNRRIRNGYVGRAKLYPSDTQSLLKIPIEALVEVQGDDVTLYTVVQDSIAKVAVVNPVYISEDYIYVAGNNNLSNVITTGAGYMSNDLVVDARNSSSKLK